MFFPSIQTEVKAKNAEPCESFYQEINLWNKLDHKLPHFVSHNFYSEGETQETQTPEFCSKKFPGTPASPVAAQFSLRIVPARSICQKRMESTDRKSVV